MVSIKYTESGKAFLDTIENAKVEFDMGLLSPVSYLSIVMDALSRLRQVNDVNICENDYVEIERYESVANEIINNALCGDVLIGVRAIINLIK